MTDGEELTVSSTIFAAGLAGLLISISVQIVVVDMLRSILTMSGVSDCVEATIGDPIPSSLGLVSKEDVASILPSEPSVHLLRQVKHLIRGLFVHPVVEGRVKVLRTVGIDELGETVLKTREHIIEGKGVS